MQRACSCDSAADRGVDADCFRAIPAVTDRRVGYECRDGRSRCIDDRGRNESKYGAMENCVARNAASSRAGAAHSVERGDRGSGGVGGGTVHRFGARAYHEMFQTITGRAALEMTAAGGGPLDGSLLDVVRQTPGVAAAVPLVQRNAIMYYSGGRMKLQAWASTRRWTLRCATISWSKAAPCRKVRASCWTMRSHNLGVRVGDEVKLLCRGLVATTVLGLVKPAAVWP